MDVGDGTTCVEGDGEVGGGDVVGEFCDSQDVVGILSEESMLEPTAKGFDGNTNGFKRIVGILHNSVPSGGGEADLVREAAHK